MANLEDQGPYQAERAGIPDRPEDWRELLPDILWPAVFVLLVLMVVGLVL
jgi:hypothetical protein